MNRHGSLLLPVPEIAAIFSSVAALSLRQNDEGQSEQIWPHWVPGYQDSLQFLQRRYCCYLCGLKENDPKRECHYYELWPC